MTFRQQSLFSGGFHEDESIIEMKNARVDIFQLYNIGWSLVNRKNNTQKGRCSSNSIIIHRAIEIVLPKTNPSNPVSLTSHPSLSEEINSV